MKLDFLPLKLILQLPILNTKHLLGLEPLFDGLELVLQASGLHLTGRFELVVHEQSHALQVVLVLLAEDELLEDACDRRVLLFLLRGEIARACLVLSEELTDLFKSKFGFLDGFGALSLMNNDRLLSLLLT